MEDIGLEKKYVFISDQQNGLVAVFEEMFESIEHRICLRHMYANFKKKFGGDSAIRDLMMGAAKATYLPAWEKKMYELRLLDTKAWEWLAKDNPIITMCEWIRNYLMNRVAVSLTKLDRWKHKIMPMPRKRLDKEVVMSGNWIPTWCQNMVWQVSHTFDGHQFIVDLSKKTCTCCFWELVGIPCRHAIAAMSYQKLDPETFVDGCYSRETYTKCYSNSVSPTNGMDMWPSVEVGDMLPPTYKKGPGRPRKLRIIEHDENGSRMGSPGVNYRCTKCDSIGHNSRKCQSQEQNPAALMRKVNT
ncbi:uncharacterized protein LOC131648214 [Vicia villosa]|uniref:uncharacterized protein LOC131648214 n=1 Tax=Vicia villosa TaxID=3911 RepID=UPI00273BA30B|nr:uncharacterized protein LOC131648214 [Vicia villosa]